MMNDVEVNYYESTSSSSEEESTSSDEDNKTQFIINQGSMYITSCNINQEIIPLTLQGILDVNKKCKCYVGGSTNPGNIYLNEIYDVYCTFFSYKLNSNSFSDCGGNLIIINIDELNFDNYINYDNGATIPGEGLIQCPSKIMIPIDSTCGDSSAFSSANVTYNSDTIYITSILPKKLSTLSLTFSYFDICKETPPIGENDRFFIKLLFKKTNGNNKLNILKKKKNTLSL